MSNNLRKQFQTAVVLDQAFLDASQDNLVNNLELIVDIEKPGGGYIHASDRNKYVVTAGVGVFYEALLTFPVIKRTVGQFQSPTLEFSTLEMELSNVDGRFNHLLPAGADYAGWVGKSVTVKLGLGEIASTYRTIFTGFVTDQGGFRRNVSSITLVARDKFDAVNKSFPNQVLTKANYPDIESDMENTLVPVIYGDWTVQVETDLASVPALVVNGANVNVNGDTSFSQNIKLVIANHPLVSFDHTQVFLRRGEKSWLIPSADIASISIGGTPSSFEIKQQSGTLTAITPDTTDQTLEFGHGDDFFVKVKGLDLSGQDDNIVAQAKSVLKIYGGLADGDFDANWAAFAAKATPAVSAISLFKSRVWLQAPENVLEFALSLLEQVRLEAFISRDLKVKILSLHLEDYQVSPSFTVRNWDTEIGSFRLSIDERTNFNRAKAVYNFLPNRNENFKETHIYKNNASIAQAGKPVSKKVVFPNLYIESTVIDQLKGILQISSAYLENVEMSLTWRSMLLDIGDFVKLNIKIQSTEFESVPALIREIGYDPAGIKIPMKLWSFQMLPFPGYTPGYSGTVGGSTAIIDEET